MLQSIVTLFEQAYGHPPADVARIAPDGSQRAYYRLTGAAKGPVIGGYDPDPDETRAFLSFTRAFRGIGLPVPELYAADEPRGVWLEEDLGDTTLFQALSAARARDQGAFPPALLDAYERTIDLLPRFQVEGARVVDFAVAHPRAAFDRQSMMWDLNYFKYHFLKLAHVPFNEQRLENDFERLVDHLLQADLGHFLYRDFQSRNVMLVGGAPRFIDYQGGRRGALQYDVASLLYDAKADLPEPVRARLLDRYLAALAATLPGAAERFLDHFAGYVLMRITQAMGAYGYRGFFERKPRFLQSVPHAARNLAGLIEQGLPLPLPELEAVFGRIIGEWAHRAASVAPPGLTLHIRSFGYPQGVPPDETGHGGGFVFDCRALPNPGREARFAGVTGRDAPVIEYLEARPETQAFWSHVVPLVDAHIDSFRARGFSDLAVAFGCTGGQHRSVYFAERLARHVRERHPDVRIDLEHGERARWPLAAGAAAPPEPALRGRSGAAGEA